MRALGMVGIAAVTLMAMATPAQAQRWGGHHRHHDHGGSGFILGALLGGALVAIAASDDHRQRERERIETVEEPADAPPPPETAPERTSFANITDPDRASDACAAAAQDAGQRYARLTSVGAIDGVDQAGETWMVRGTLLLRDDYRTRGTEHGFRCTIASGGEPDVRIDGFEGG